MHSIIKVLFRALFNPRIKEKYRKGRLCTIHILDYWNVLSTEEETAPYTPTHKQLHSHPTPCVMFLMSVAPLQGQEGEGWALEIESFLSPVKWHRSNR